MTRYVSFDPALCVDLDMCFKVRLSYLEITV